MKKLIQELNENFTNEEIEAFLTYKKLDKKEPFLNKGEEREKENCLKKIKNCFNV